MTEATLANLPGRVRVPACQATLASLPGRVSVRVPACQATLVSLPSDTGQPARQGVCQGASLPSGTGQPAKVLEQSFRRLESSDINYYAKETHHVECFVPSFHRIEETRILMLIALI